AAREDASRALEIARTLGARDEIVAALIDAARIDAGERRFDPALAALREALETAKAMGSRALEARCERELGSTLGAQYRVEDATHELERALEIYRSPEVADVAEAARTLGSIADVLATHGDFAAAKSRYEEALELAAKPQAVPIAQQCLL